MPVKITYFVHGTTTDNEQDLATGCEPGELSEQGIRQAKELPKRVSDKDFAVIFCSDLKRAVDSAVLGFGKTHKIIQDRRLRECDYGDYTKRPAKDFNERMQEFVDKRFPNGESYRDVEKRIADFLSFIKKKYQGVRIAIIAHQAPQLALDVILNNKTWDQAIDQDWRKKKEWQPGWDYILE